MKIIYRNINSYYISDEFILIQPIGNASYHTLASEFAIINGEGHRAEYTALIMYSLRSIMQKMCRAIAHRSKLVMCEFRGEMFSIMGGRTRP